MRLVRMLFDRRGIRQRLGLPLCVNGHPAGPVTSRSRRRSAASNRARRGFRPEVGAS